MSWETWADSELARLEKDPPQLQIVVGQPEPLFDGAQFVGYVDAAGRHAFPRPNYEGPTEAHKHSTNEMETKQ